MIGDYDMIPYEDIIVYTDCSHCKQYTFFNMEKKEPTCHRCGRKVMYGIKTDDTETSTCSMEEILQDKQRHKDKGPCVRQQMRYEEHGRGGLCCRHGCTWDQV